MVFRGGNGAVLLMLLLLNSNSRSGKEISHIHVRRCLVCILLWRLLKMHIVDFIDAILERISGSNWADNV